MAYQLVFDFYSQQCWSQSIPLPDFLLPYFTFVIASQQIQKWNHISFSSREKSQAILITTFYFLRKGIYKVTGEGNGNPLQSSCLNVPWMGSLGGFRPRGRKESDTAKHIAHTRQCGKHPVHKVSVKQTPTSPRREAIWYFTDVFSFC